MARRDAVELAQYQRVGEEDRIVEKRLRDHQGKAHQRALPIAMEQRMRDLYERRMTARVQFDGWPNLAGSDAAPRRRRTLDVRDDYFSPVGIAVNHQPSRALRNPEPHDEDHQSESRAGQIGQPPSEIGAHHLRIQQDDSAHRADRGPDPETAVDDQIGPAAIARRHQFLNRRVDRGILSADAGAGEKPEQRVAPDVPRQRRGCRGHEIERQRDEEQLLASETVRQPAEAERAQHRAGQIGAVGETDIEVTEAKRSAVFQRARQRACQSHLESIENPGDAQSRDDARMETAPAQRIEPRRNIRFDHAAIDIHWQAFISLGRDRSLPSTRWPPSRRCARTPNASERQ